MSSYLTIVEEGKRVPRGKREKSKKRELLERSFYDRLASTDWFSNNVNDHFPEGYDEVCDKTYEEHAKFCRFLRRVDRHRKLAAKDFMFYPRCAFAAGQFWELSFPVLDIAQFRASHHLEKYKRLPTSLFWTNFDSNDEKSDRDLLESKFEMIEELVHELLGQGMDVRDSLANQRLHHQLSHQMARDREFIEYLKIVENKAENKKQRALKKLLAAQDAELREMSKKRVVKKIVRKRY